MAPLVQDVLVGFVTPSDPGTDRGPANIITVAKAKLPQALYLFHTHDTQANVEALKNWIQSDPDLVKQNSPKPFTSSTPTTPKPMWKP